VNLGNMHRLQEALLAPPTREPRPSLSALARRLAHRLAAPARSLSQFMAASGRDAPVIWAVCTAMAVLSAMYLVGWTK